MWSSRSDRPNALRTAALQTASMSSDRPTNPHRRQARNNWDSLNPAGSSQGVVHRAAGIFVHTAGRVPMNLTPTLGAQTGAAKSVRPCSAPQALRLIKDSFATVETAVAMIHSGPTVEWRVLLRSSDGLLEKGLQRSPG
jgi:hypothetical protein